VHLGHMLWALYRKKKKRGNLVVVCNVNTVYSELGC
jgi:hypothetical protein